jgi:SAM-dependent methyltransferase
VSTPRHYEAAAQAWFTGAEPAYLRYADALVAASPEPLAGLRVLDVGAGTGAACRSLRAAGAVVTAADAAVAMLSVARSELPELGVVAADALALPFGDGCWDAATSAFCVNHLEHPDRLLREAGRVVRRGGVVLASTYAEGPDHPDHEVKAIVDTVLTRWGWVPSAFSTLLRTTTSVLTGTPDRLQAVAVAAGLADVRVLTLEVDTGLRTADELVAWRLGLADPATYLLGLDVADQRALRAEAVAALGRAPAPLVRAILVLVARAP